MNLKGMNTEQVRGFGSQLQNARLGEFQSQISAIRSNVQGLDWRGTDAQQFKGEMWNNIQTLFHNFETALRDMAATAIHNADAQDTTTSNY